MKLKLLPIVPHPKLEFKIADYKSVKKLSSEDIVNYDEVRELLEDALGDEILGQYYDEDAGRVYIVVLRKNIPTTITIYEFTDVYEVEG